MIAEVNIISGKVSIASANGSGGLGVLWGPQYVFETFWDLGLK